MVECMNSLSIIKRTGSLKLGMRWTSFHRDDDDGNDDDDDDDDDDEEEEEEEDACYYHNYTITK